MMVLETSQIQTMPEKTGGQGVIKWKKKHCQGIPQIIIKLSNSVDELKSLLRQTDNKILEKYWNKKVRNKVDEWVKLVEKNTGVIQPFNFVEYLKEKLE